MDQRVNVPVSTETHLGCFTRVANAVGYLTSVLLRASEQDSLEERNRRCIEPPEYRLLGRFLYR